jgi:hypothetical protein
MYTEDGFERDIPVLYISIVPLLSFGPSFNFSIWYVELQGIENDAYVCDMMRNFNDEREKQATRLVLKHLRDKGYMNAFRALEKEANINLEDNQITDLFQCLVEDGNFQKAEEIMKKFVESEFYILTKFVTLIDPLFSQTKATSRITFRIKSTKQSTMR